MEEMDGSLSTGNKIYGDEDPSNSHWLSHHYL
jgi:hypothetical protein